MGDKLCLGTGAVDFACRQRIADVHGDGAVVFFLGVNAGNVGAVSNERARKLLQLFQRSFDTVKDVVEYSRSERRAHGSTRALHRLVRHKPCCALIDLDCRKIAGYPDDLADKALVADKDHFLH